MASKIQPSASKRVVQPSIKQPQNHSAVQPQSPSKTTNSFKPGTSNFTPAGARPLISLDGAPTNTPIASGLPIFRAGQGGTGGARFDDSDEFGYTLNATLMRFGEAAVSTLQGVYAQIHRGEQPAVSTSVPQAGDVMVWAPNSGSQNSPVGGANEEGHAGVVESVTYNGNGTVTIRVSEREWANSDGMTNGVPYRDITVPLNSDGTLALPDGVGFVHLNPNTPATGTGNTGTGNTGTGNTGTGTPPLGTNNPPIDNPDFQIHNTPHITSDGWVQCAGYIHDIPGYTALVEAWTTANGGTLNGGDFPTNSTVPVEGGLMVWEVGAETPSGGSTGSRGHVAYVEEVQKNYDSSGNLVSYTITISQANGDGSGTEDRSLETFTVPVNANGEPDVPEGVGFYVPSGGTSSAAPVGNTASSSGASIPHNSTYSVQQGDTLTSIANRAGVTIKEILAENPEITDPNSIQAGQEIYIP